MSLSNFLDKTAAEILDGNSPTFSKRESKGIIIKKKEK